MLQQCGLWGKVKSPSVTWHNSDPSFHCTTSLYWARKAPKRKDNLSQGSSFAQQLVNKSSYSLLLRDQPHLPRLLRCALESLRGVCHFWWATSSSWFGHTWLNVQADANPICKLRGWVSSAMKQLSQSSGQFMKSALHRSLQHQPNEQ